MGKITKKLLKGNLPMEKRQRSHTTNFNLLIFLSLIPQFIATSMDGFRITATGVWPQPFWLYGTCT